MKILLDVAKESSDYFPPLKSALGFVNALIKHYEVCSSGSALSYKSDNWMPQHCEDVKEKIEEFIPLLERFKQDFTVARSDGDQAEKQRRSELSKYVCRSLNTIILANGLAMDCSVRWKRSRRRHGHCWTRALQPDS